ncbi:unnamed protein product [Caretta caretta]
MVTASLADWLGVHRKASGGSAISEGDPSASNSHPQLEGKPRSFAEGFPTQKPWGERSPSSISLGILTACRHREWPRFCPRTEDNTVPITGVSEYLQSH